MSGVTGIILSNLHDGDVPMLTRKRTMGAVPFGGYYRMVDFPLSAMVNAGLTEIFIIAHHNYHSLMEHIGSGKDWDLARHRGGIRILPPYNAAYANPKESYHSRLQSLLSIKGLLDRVRTEHILCADCDTVSNPDFGKLIAAHEKSGAPMTLGVEENAVAGDNDLHIWIARTAFLREILREAELKKYTSFTTDVIRRQILQGTVSVYHFGERFYRIRSLDDYFRLHIRLATDRKMREELLGDSNRPVMTKVRAAPPVRYGENALVSNALIAEGCVIDGCVRNSVIFGHVRIGGGCLVENSVVLEGCRLEAGAKIGFSVLDKNVFLAGATLHGHSSLPFFVEEGKIIG